MVPNSVNYILLFLLSIYTFHIYAQDISTPKVHKYPKALNKIISIDETNIPLSEILKILSDKGDIRFNYNRTRIPISKPVTVVMDNFSIKKILDYICNLTSTKLLITKGDNILIVPSNFNEILKGKIVGRIYDRKTKRSLVGANVLVEGYNFGSASNIKGEISIENLPVGNYNIKISYIGYQPVILTDIIVKSDKSTFFNVELNPQLIMGSEVLIEDDYFSLPSLHTTTSSKFSYDATVVSLPL